eukprot:gene23523-28529_t
MNKIIYFIYWVILPFLNFLLWFYLGKTRLLDHNAPCSSPPTNNSPETDSLKQILEASLLELQAETRAQPCAAVEASQSINVQTCSPPTPTDIENRMHVQLVETNEFDKYRTGRLASMTLDIVLQTYTSQDTIVVTYGDSLPKVPSDMLPADPSHPCRHLDHHFLDISQDTCFAVYLTPNSNITYDIQRFDSDIDIYGLSISNPDPSQIDKYSAKYAPNVHNKGHQYPTGFFRKVPKERGRERTKEKLGTFLKYFADIEKQLRQKFRERGIQKGDDIVVMVVNEGELDLFVNFACSCRFHSISMSHILVFAGSEGMVRIVEATGAMGLYHTGFASVSRKASQDYLDRVFVDMMWYKAFSVYIVLREGLNILFQDVDLVWFREPWQYFKEYMAESQVGEGTPVMGFFSDDGQRSKRYTPFFANSGFYYLKSSPESTYFTWSVMIAMDAIQVLGSHQNVFTTRLIEGLALNFASIKLLPLEDFPTGIMYHHHREYMRLLDQGKVHPYNFHMCWTQGKSEKLRYLRNVKMWYLSEVCSPLENLIESGYEQHEGGGLRGASNGESGKVFQYVEGLKDMEIDKQWNSLAHMCCNMMDGAP